MQLAKNVDASQYKDIDKVVLAYSGGVDTSILLKLIQDVCKTEVYTVTLNFGQPEYASFSFDDMKKKAKALGAKEAYFINAEKEFVDNYVSKAIQANSLYQGEYPNSTTIGRPLIAKHLVGVAEKVGADAIAHGCTGKGNDQVRMDISVLSLNPNMEIIAPVRDWNLMRDEQMEWAHEQGIELPVKKSSPYSVDANIWGKSSECGILEHPDKEAPEDVFTWVTLPEKAPDKPVVITLHFEKGVPSKLDYNGGYITDSVAIVKALNKLAGESGIGIIDHMEDRTIGLKSREIYECPAALVILKAHKDLEKYVLTKEENEFKPVVDKAWTEMVYKGLWFSPLMGELDAFIGKSQENVSGWVKLKLYKGSAAVVARHSDHAIYDHSLATYNKHTTFDQTHSIGFIKLWGMNTILANQVGKK